MWSVPLLKLVFFYILGYVGELLTKLWTVVKNDECATKAMIHSPPPLCSSYKHPMKHEAITEHKTRFSKIVIP